MKSILLLFIGFFFCINSIFSQHGTLIVAGIGKDGLVMVADSRGAMADRKGNLIAYIDSFPKIFKLKDFYVAITGNIAIAKTFLSTIISDFNKISLMNTSFLSVVDSFVNYSNRLYPVSKFPESSTTSFIFVGCEKNDFFIKGYMRDLGFSKLIRSSTLISSSDATKYLGVYAHSFKYSCDTLEDAFKKTIYDYAKGENLIYNVGGPLSVLRIGINNKLIYFKNSFAKNIFQNTKEYLKALESGKRKFIPIVPGGDKQAIEAVKEYYK